MVVCRTTQVSLMFSSKGPETAFTNHGMRELKIASDINGIILSRIVSVWRSILSVSQKKFRGAFLRVRLGINDLIINTRFYVNSPHDMTCPFCDCLEDDTNFMTDCTADSEVRRKYLQRYLRPGDNRTCTSLFKGASEGMTRAVAMYIYYVFKTR